MRTRRVKPTPNASGAGGARRSIIVAIRTPDPLKKAPLAAIAAAFLLAACTQSSHVSASNGGPGANHPSRPRALRLSIAPAGYRLDAPVQRAVAASDGRVVYVAGGLDSSGTSVAGVFSLDSASGKLTSLGSMPFAFHDAAAAIIGGKLVVFGGGSSHGTDLVQAFDLKTREASVIGHLPVALSDLESASVGDTVYLVGGYDGRTPRREIYATRDGRHFTVAGKIPVGLRYAAVTAVGGTIVVAGGQSASSATTSNLFALDTASGSVSRIGRLPRPVAHAAAFTIGGVAYIVGGQDAGGDAVSTVTEIDPAAGTVRTEEALVRPVSDTAVATARGGALLIGGWRGSAVDQILAATLVTVAGPGSPSPTATPTKTPAADHRPFAGLLLIADRGNNRLLVMNAHKHVVWRFPSPTLPKPPVPFYFPDDAFWVHGGHAILVNEEGNDVLTEIAYPSGKTLWTYGHPGAPGAAAGFLHQPDDVYPYPGGGLVVADALNCRILFFGPAGRPTRQIGTTGRCTHGLPDTVGYPNGDTPLPGGHLLISELNGGWIDEITSTGRVVWSAKVPGVPVPSDPQRFAGGTFLAASYSSPGAVVRFTKTGHVVWTYRPASGHGELNHPSLAAPLPNGLIAVNDDYNHRVVLIDPKTKRIVWQYGVTGVSGSGPGHLSFPDGLDLLLPGGAIPLHVDFAANTLRHGRP